MSDDQGWPFSAASPVMVTAKFGSAEDTPPIAAPTARHYRIAEESFLGRDLLKPSQRRCCARRLFANAHHFSRDDTHLASAWIEEFRAPPAFAISRSPAFVFMPLVAC